jgi:hypothetical protein
MAQILSTFEIKMKNSQILQNKSKFLIANLCFHQVMAESLYHILSNIGTVHIISNEDTMPWEKSIPPHNITQIKTSASFKSNLKDAFSKRIGRLKVLWWIYTKKKQFDYVIFTAGTEYIPKGIRLISYVLLKLITSSRTIKVIETLHKISFWESIFKNPSIKNKILRNSINEMVGFASVSDRILQSWKNRGYANISQIQIPFVVPKDGYKRICRSPIDRMVICVHGTTTLKRRRYDIMFDALKLLPDNKRNLFDIIFQGPPVSSDDRAFINRLSGIVSTKWRDHYMSSDEMRVLMEEVDIIIAPLNAKYGYGTDNESGVGFDCYRYQIGGIVPEEICSNEFAPALITYSSVQNLRDVFLSLDKNMTAKLSQSSSIVAAAYTDAQWALKLKPIIESM